MSTTTTIKQNFLMFHQSKLEEQKIRKKEKERVGNATILTIV